MQVKKTLSVCVILLSASCTTISNDRHLLLPDESRRPSSALDLGSERSVSQIFECIEKASKILSNRNRNNNKVFSLKVVSEECINNIGAPNIVLEEASVSGSVYKIALSIQPQGIRRLFFFNLPQSRLVSDTPSKNRKRSSINPNRILADYRNSASFNSCEKKSESGYPEEILGLRNAPSGKACDRICKKGTYFEAIKAPVFYSKDNAQFVGLIKNETDGKENEYYAEIRCTSCPKDYPNTDEMSNACYNKDGCSEGYEFVSAPYDKGFVSDYAKKESVFDRNKLCVRKCEKGTITDITRLKDEQTDVNDRCVPSKELVCAELKVRLRKMSSWYDRFKSAANKGSKIGSCKVSIFLKAAGSFVLPLIKKYQDSIATNCLDFKNLNVTPFRISFLAHYDDWFAEHGDYDDKTAEVPTSDCVGNDAGFFPDEMDTSVFELFLEEI